MGLSKRRQSIEWLQIAANIGSLVVAVAALFFTFQTENRSAERFDKQLEQSNQIAKANIRPLLSIGTSGFMGIKLVSLKNSGLGTAVVKDILFKKGEKTVRNLAKLFEFKKQVIWDNFYSFTASDFFLRAGESVMLVNLTAERLQQRGYNASDINYFMNEFDLLSRTNQQATV